MEKDIIIFKTLILSLNRGELKNKYFQNFENTETFSRLKVKRFDIINIYTIRERIQLENNQREIANQIHDVVKNLESSKDEFIYLWKIPEFKESENINHYIFFTNLEITDCYGIVNFHV
ncbi:MAG: hypothetical protein U5N85_07980 [Arcicella sp.]|nr:hypothetical protein [Arcicella sp.]